MKTPSELEKILHSAHGRTVVNALLQTTPSIAVIVDSDGRILRVSRYACELSGLSAEELEGLSLKEFVAVVEPRAPDGRLLNDEEFPLAQALEGRTQLGQQGYFRDRHGQRIPIVSNVAPFLGASGKVIGAITSVTDLRAFRALEAELRAAIAEKEVLFRELAHRVKNHLQVVSGLVALEARHDAPSAQELADRIGGRLQMLAAIYDSMSEMKAGGRIQARPFLQQAVQPYRSKEIEIEVATPEEATLAPDQAGPLGMLVNEAVCNSFKHAFPQRHGRIAVALRQVAPEHIDLEVADDGVGFASTSAGRSSQGLRLMRLLAGQLGGQLDLSAAPSGGAKVVAHLPISIGVTPPLQEPISPSL